MAVEGTDIYHQYVDDETYVDESLVNRVTESGQTEPFFPESITTPETDQDRQEILSRAVRDDTVPVIISPSGMLTGGNSPRYLAEFAARFGTASVFLTGYQATNTTGRTLQSQYQADQETISATIDATPLGTDWPDSTDVQWVPPENDNGSELKTRLSFLLTGSRWLTDSAATPHRAAYSHLLGQWGQTQSRSYTAPTTPRNGLDPTLLRTSPVSSRSLESRRLSPIAVGADSDVDTAAISPEEIDSTGYTDLEDQIDHLYDLLSQLNGEVAAARNETGLSEAEIREIVRDEIETEE